MVGSSDPPMVGYPHPDLRFEVWGPYACFTNPALKTERVSYAVPTPSAARGVVEAIFWKPEVSVVITRIEVLEPVRWMRLTRNEVTAVVTDDWVTKAMNDTSVRFDAAEVRDQRSTLLLRDVRYRISFQYVLRERADTPVAKYRDQFRRRLDRGAAYSQPFLGTREFSADFGPATDAPPVSWNSEKFIMLHSILYDERGGERYTWFPAEVAGGVLEVPAQGIELGTSAGREQAAKVRS